MSNALWSTLDHICDSDPIKLCSDSGAVFTDVCTHCVVQITKLPNDVFCRTHLWCQVVIHDCYSAMNGINSFYIKNDVKKYLVWKPDVWFCLHKGQEQIRFIPLA